MHKMEVLFIGGRFESKYYDEVIAKTKTLVDYAANIFQTRLVQGLREQDISLTEVSAPVVGPWPTAYRDAVFHGFKENGEKSSMHYVHFVNIWGYRNISRAKHVKREVKKFLDETKGCSKRAIIVYSAHTPYLEAAEYAKRLSPDVHIHLVVPDMPQFMNINSNKLSIYWAFKRIDIKVLYKLNHAVDSYTLLTKYMVDSLEVGNRPYIIVEGIAEEPHFAVRKNKKGKRIVYAGNLYEKCGVKTLVDAFILLPDADARLIICGGGEMSEYIQTKAQEDRRIEYYGLLPSDKARELIISADVLVNPRRNEGEYVKYSFPSKNIEYLLSGNAVVAYMLDGIPEIYREFFIVPNDDSTEALTEALQSALDVSREKQAERFQKALQYLRENCSSEVVTKRIMRLVAGDA